MRPKCPDCSGVQWSQMDKMYLELYGTCWTCDKERWTDGKLSLEDFEAREQKALETAS